MHGYLATHPGIAMSRRKEPGYWSPDLGRRDPVRDRIAYLALWDGAPEDALRGEATANYLRSAVAVPAILAERPDARFVVMLRDPVDMVVSFHAELVKTYHEDVSDLERAWRLQDVRRQGRRIPVECADPRLLDYARVCATGDQLERLCAIVPEQQRLVVLFDDLKRDTRSVYLQVLAFLRLEDDGRRDFAPANVRATLRSPAAARVHRSLPHRLGPLYAPARAVAARAGISPSRLINRANARHGPSAPLEPRFREELAQVFAPQVDKLESLLGCDLSHWR